MNQNITQRRYGHVAIVGLDGMGSFCKDAATPCMDAIFEDGAKTLRALSMFPTISAQNWGAMLLGAAPEVHGLTNGGISQQPYTNADLPSVFATVRRAYPDSVLCSVSNWGPINHGIIEQDAGVEKEAPESGEATTERAVACVLARKPDLLFVHIDDPDEAGHHYGYGTAGHLETITRVDAMVGRIHESYRQAGLLDDTLFLVITDHGGYKRGHGGYTEGYSSQVPENVFRDWETPYVKDVPGARCDVAPRPQPDFHGEKGLTAFFNEDEIRLALFFEYNAEDAAGKARFSEVGQVKYYAGSVRGAYAELGATGCLVSEDVRFGCDDFTVCAWLKVDGAPATEAYYCATKTMTDSGAGFALGFTEIATWLGVETPDPRSYQEHITPYTRDVSGGWLHVTFAFRRKENKVDLYQNFRLKRTVTLPDCFTGEPMDTLPFTVGDEASHGINTGNDALVCLDDLLIFGKAFSADDLKKLADYYEFEP